MWRTITVPLHERAVALRGGRPLRALAPGTHRVLGVNVEAVRWDVRRLVFEAAPELRALLPAAWFETIAIGARERGVVSADGKPAAWLRPGVHRVWKVDPGVAIEVLSIDAPAPVLSKELAAIVPAGEIVEVVVAPHERGVLFVQGQLQRVLGPGRSTLWTHPEAAVEVLRVDVRRHEIPIPGQELMTKDKVTLRLSLTAEVRVLDPVLAVTAVESVRDAVYLGAQLAARGLVAGMTLDELLAARDAIARQLTTEVAADAIGFGVEVLGVGIKDVVLPGEMKTLLNRVIEAEKEAMANVILRREETAATRQLANTARLMAESPMLLRMKELETMKEIAGQLREVRLVVGADKLEALWPSKLLGGETGGRGPES